MQKYGILNIIILCTFLNVFSINKIDSIKNAIQQIDSTKNTSKYNQLQCQLAYELAVNKPDTSLKIVNWLIEKNETDSVFLANCYKLLGDAYYFKNNKEKAITYYEKATNLFLKYKDTLQLQKLYFNIGYIQNQLEHYYSAINAYNKSLKYSDTTKFSKIADVYANIGYSYMMVADYEKSIAYYKKALDYNNRLYMPNKKSEAVWYKNIGIIFLNLKSFNKANEYYTQALELYKASYDTVGMADIYMNFGMLNKNLEKYQQAIQYYKIVEKLYKKINNQLGLAHVYNNMASNYAEMDSNSLAIAFAQKAKQINKKLNNERGLAYSNYYMANVYFNLNDYSKTLQYLNLTLETSKLYDLNEMIISTYNLFAKTYKQLQKFKIANYYIELKYALQDSLITSEMHKQIADMQAKYEAEEREREIEKLNKEKQIQQIALEKDKVEIRNQNILIVSIIVFCILLVILFISYYKRYKIKKKSNQELLKQKNKIENQRNEIEKYAEELHAQRDLALNQRNKIAKQQGELYDSIAYAEKIQKALLPDIEVLNNCVSDYFLLYKPRDVVSGDFYWLLQNEDYLIVTVADCTGHGVPGAFMSVLGMSFLEELVKDKQISQPDEILNKLRDKIIMALKQKEVFGTAKDGMDMALCMINQKTKTLKYAGANNSLYLIRKNTDENYELNEFKPDKMPIGIFAFEPQPFNNHTIKLQANDRFYLFSDGYADQFGGEKGKKYMLKRFKRKLLNIQNMTMPNQKQALETEFTSWKNNYDQIDDVCVLGIEI